MSTSTTSRPGRPGLASFWVDLPREGRLLLSVVVLEFLGTGLVLPFHVVYLSEVRDFPLATVGLLLALQPLAGVLATGPAGVLIDRLGARRVLLATLVLLVAGNTVLALGSSLLVAGAGLVLIGTAFGVTWPASQSLVASVVPAALRQRYFGVNFALLNLGIGLGGVVGGFVVDVDVTATFQAVYLADAVSYLPALVLLLWPLRHVAGSPEPVRGESPADVGYLAVLRRPGVRPLVVLSFLGSFVGYAQLNTGLPAYARALGEVSTRGLGFAFAANTAVIVVLQLFVLQRIEGRRRTRVIAAMGVVWAVAWLLLGASGLVPGTLGATLLVTACASVFALGETLLQPTIPALTNDLAPDHLRGRYNALSSAAFNGAAIVAPPVTGLLVGGGLGILYVAMLVSGSLLLAAYAVTRVEPHLPAHVNGVRSAEPKPGEPVAAEPTRTSP